MKTEMVSYCLYYVCAKKLWWNYVLRKGVIKMTENYLSHHGVKGMKWGIRKNEKKAVSKGKRHLGINEKGNISFINEKTTNEAKAKFAAKLLISTAGIALSVYLSKHPNLIHKGMKFVNGVSNKPVDSNYKVFSKSLGRYLTEQELIDKGLL